MEFQKGKWIFILLLKFHSSGFYGPDYRNDGKKDENISSVLISFLFRNFSRRLKSNK